MYRNFFLMPGFLKFLTAMAFLNGVFIISSMLPGGVNIDGRIVRTSEWWSNGSGFAFVAALLPLTASGVLMLLRTRYSRFAHVVGWLLQGVGVFAVTKINNVDVSRTSGYAGVGFVLAATLVIAIYVYRSKSARLYFDTQ